MTIIHYHPEEQSEGKRREALLALHGKCLSLVSAREGARDRYLTAQAPASARGR